MGVLYASAYFLHPIGYTGAYLLPARDLLQWVVWPSLAGATVAGGLLYVVSAVVHRWCRPRIASVSMILILTFLTMIALKGIMDVCGYDWQDRIPHVGDLLDTQRYFKIVLFLCLVTLLSVVRTKLRRLMRLLTSLGAAFGLLAVVRLFVLWYGSLGAAALTTPASASALTAHHAGSRNSANAVVDPVGRPRRVVWVIFDETDFGRLYGAEAAAHGELKNFDELERNGVFATDANSPASATLYSVPALLTGVPLGGRGVKIDAAASLTLEDNDGRFVAFNQATTIFGALAAAGLNASVLGFYHPYCKLFVLQRCDSFAWPEVGGLDGALWANIPGAISTKMGHQDPWSSISERGLQLLPQYLVRDDALTFVHLNVPHLPATYADRLLHLPPSSNPSTEYSRNLTLADQILGGIMRDLRRQAASHDLLLVVSTDHWLRNFWFERSAEEVSRRVPLIMWKVGESNGLQLDQPVSTVHTAAMILDFLNGSVESQADIAKWWVRQPVYPSFIAPNT